VDGQQRLTTVTMILCALRDAFDGYQEPDLAKGLNEYVVKRNLENKPEAVLASQSTIPYFQSAIQRLPGTHPESAQTVEEKRLESSYQFINGKLKELLAEMVP